MKTVVIYRSKSGFVKQYAEWIAQELAADIFEASKFAADKLAIYDTVIYGGGLYAVGINGVKLITKNLDKLKGKKVVVFASGASAANEAVISEVRDKNFTAEQQQEIRFFYLRGGFDFHKLTPIDKVLMRIMRWMLKRKKELTLDEKGMLAAYKQPVDFTKKKNIAELISFVSS